MLKEMIPDEILEYINNHWKPNQDDAFVILEKGSSNHNLLSNAFDYFFRLNSKEQDNNTFDIGPFIQIRPYGVFDIEERPNDSEFLFEYDHIDHTKLSKQHLEL